MPRERRKRHTFSIAVKSLKNRVEGRTIEIRRSRVIVASFLLGRGGKGETVSHERPSSQRFGALVHLQNYRLTARLFRGHLILRRNGGTHTTCNRHKPFDICCTNYQYCTSLLMEDDTTLANTGEDHKDKKKALHRTEFYCKKLFEALTSVSS